MNLLRNYIRGIILSEGMIRPESIENHFALWTDWIPEYESQTLKKQFVLYDTVKAKQNIINFYPGRFHATDNIFRWIYISDSTPGPSEDMKQAVVATMTCTKSEFRTKPCNKAWEVSTSAAIGGHGPTMYDLVMSLSPHGLYPDRGSVSEDARDLWRFYANNRPDIEKIVMDGMNSTPTDVWDDCVVHNIDNELMRLASRKRAIDFIKNYSAHIGDPNLFNSFRYYVMSFDESDGFDGRNFFMTFRDWCSNSSIDTNELESQWLEWQKTHPIIDYIDWRITDPDFLDIIYNTDYAVASAKKMMKNHEKMLEDLNEAGIDYGSKDSVNWGFAKIAWEFFNQHYDR